LLCAETVAYYRGQTVRLACNTSRYNKYVDWEYFAEGSSIKQQIYVNGAVDVNSKRYSVQYPLVISNAVEDDEGTYICIENAGLGDSVSTYHLQYKGTLHICSCSYAVSAFLLV